MENMSAIFGTPTIPMEPVWPSIIDISPSRYFDYNNFGHGNFPITQMDSIETATSGTNSETQTLTSSSSSKSVSPDPGFDYYNLEEIAPKLEPDVESNESSQVAHSQPLLQPQPLPRSRTNHYCETVAVESSAHVAQIVGKNGCRIKHLRAKFGTYIHTPSSNDEPVFIIKGQRDKVLEVKQEIIKADNHFSGIKDARNAKISKMIDSHDARCIRLFIPNKYIGLVVGRNGWFVKDLQMKYNIYIETPKFDLCNYFQLYGKRDRLTMVTKLIYEHITKKTGINFTEKQDSDDVVLIE